MRKHTIDEIYYPHPDEAKARALALHLNSGYHQMDESLNASLSYLKSKHNDAHRKSKPK